MKDLNEKVVALSGAGSGIGRCLAIQLSQLGTSLSLADVDEEGLKQTKAFLPHLKKRPDAHIVNISSVNGFIATPRNGAYACAKHAVKGLNQTLQQELKNTSVNVTSVHPGGVRTNIARNSRSDDSQEIQQERIVGFDQIAGTSADKAATIIIKGMLKNRKRQLVGVDAIVIDVLSRLFPQKFSDAMGSLYDYTQRKRIKNIYE
jgi:short-subunit dehydrogenase